MDNEYTTSREVGVCDCCDAKRIGTMYECRGTPVLFLCERHDNSRLLWSLLDRAVRLCRRTYKRAVYVATTTRAERAQREREIAERRAALRARRSS